MEEPKSRAASLTQRSVLFSLVIATSHFCLDFCLLIFVKEPPESENTNVIKCHSGWLYEMREPKGKSDGPNSEIFKSALNKHSSNTNLFSPYFAHDIMFNYVSYIKNQGLGMCCV